MLILHINIDAGATQFFLIETNLELNLIPNSSSWNKD